MPQIDFDKVRSKGSEFLSGFTTGQKIVTGFAIFAVVFGAFYFTRWASEPDYTVLFSGLDPADASAVTESLSSQGVSYQLEDGGSTVLVPRGDVYQTRIDLSAKNLPSGGSEGFSLLDNQGITTSDFRQRIDYQRAIQGELQRTISSMNDVAAASVMITVPQNDVFTDDAEQATASVLITERPGKSLKSGQVQAIVHLVAGSVMGLTPENVTVANASGALLSGDAGGGAAGLDDNVERKAAFERQVAADIQELLVPVAGVGSAVVKVNSTLDFDQRESVSEQYQLAEAPPGQPAPPPLEDSSATETYTGPGNGTGGVLGVDGGVTGGTTGGEVNYTSTESATKQPYGKITETVRNAPGQVQQLSVAVLLNADAVAQGDVAGIQSMVEAAAGISAVPTLGTVEITRLPFDTSVQDAALAEAEAAAAADQRSSMMGIVQTVVALLLVGIVLFIAWRAMKKSGASSANAVRVPLDVRELTPDRRAAVAVDAPIDSYELPPFDGPTLAEVEPSDQARLQEELSELIDRQPEEVAMTLRGWLADRRN